MVVVVVVWRGPNILGGGDLSDFQPCGWVFQSLKCHHQGFLNNPIKLWPPSISHPFSLPNSSLGLDGHYQKISIQVYQDIFKILHFQVALLILSYPIISPYTLITRLMGPIWGPMLDPWTLKAIAFELHMIDICAWENFWRHVGDLDPRSRCHWSG